MGRKTFKNVAEPLEPLRSYRADADSPGCEPSEMELDAMARETRSSPSESRQESNRACSDEAGAAVNEPTEAEVRQRAYEICQARNETASDCMADWLQAEQELRAHRASQTT